MIAIHNVSEGMQDRIVIVGEVDAGSSINLDQAIKNSVKKGSKKILIDCQQLTYISSAGLGVFMSYIEEFREHNIHMILFGLNAKVLHTFEIIGLAELLHISKSEKEANKLMHELSS